MRKIVIGWIFIGSLGVFILPWYMINDGFFSFSWLFEYELENYGPSIFFALSEKKWLLPLVGPLIFPIILLFFKSSRRTYSNIFLISGILGFVYFFLQGYAIGIRGWNYQIFETLFGEVDRQFGIGIGAVLTISTFIFYVTHGLASRGWLNGDNFIVGSIWVVIILVSIFVFIPILNMFDRAFIGSEGIRTLTSFSDRFINKGLWGLDCVFSNVNCGVVWNTLTMGILTAFSSTFLGLGFALLIARTNFKFKKLFKVLSVLPIITPPFVIGLAIIILFGRSGAVSTFLEWGFEVERSRWIYGLSGIWFAQTLAFTPISFLVLIGVIESISPSMEEASQTLRASKWQVFKTVTFPLIRPGLANAFLLGFIESLADFGNPLVLGGDYNVLSTEIFFAVVGAQYDESKAAVLAIILLSMVLIAFYVQNQWLGKKSYVSITGKGDSGFYAELPKSVKNFIYFVVVPWGLLTLVIYLMIMFGGFVEMWGVDHNFTLKHYINAFSVTFDEKIGLHWTGTAWNSFSNTFWVAVLAAPPTAAFGILTAYLLTRHNFMGKRAFEFGTMLSFAIPGTIIGISYIFTFNTPPIEITGTGIILIIAFVFRNMPVGVRAGIASMNQLDPHLDEASATLNASSYQTFKNIILPLLKPAIIASLVFSFVRAMTAISAVIFLVSARYDLATSYILGRLENNDYGLAIVYSSALIVVMLITIVVIQLIVGRRKLGRRDQYVDLMQGNSG
jgi:iron(III) transport system permease protein